MVLILLYKWFLYFCPLGYVQPYSTRTSATATASTKEHMHRIQYDTKKLVQQRSMCSIPDIITFFLPVAPKNRPPITSRTTIQLPTALHIKRGARRYRWWMSTLTDNSASLHANPLGGPGSGMPERPPGSYVSARSLTNEMNFSGQAQQWHVIGSAGVTVRGRGGRGSSAEEATMQREGGQRLLTRRNESIEREGRREDIPGRAERG